MNQSIIDAAREAGIVIEDGCVYHLCQTDNMSDGDAFIADLERFAAIIRRQERERCAKVCEQTGIKHPKQLGQEACAAAIRAMDN